MPINGPQKPYSGLFFRDQRETHPVSGSAKKGPIRERFISPDCRNKPDLWLFLNGARIGLHLDPERGIRAQFGPGLGEGGAHPFVGRNHRNFDIMGSGENVLVVRY